MPESAPSTIRRIAIVGAAGYIGSHVLNELVASGANPTDLLAIDLKPVPAPDRHPGVVYGVADVRSPLVGELLLRHRAESVIHLATAVHAHLRPEEAREIEVWGTRQVLEACRTAGVRHLTVTSSAAAYGYHPDQPNGLTEADPLRGSRDVPYASHKKEVEDLLAAYARRHPELGQLILRPCTVLGEGLQNQITRQFTGAMVIGVRRSTTPFSLIWDRDLARCIVEAVYRGATGTFNVSGDGTVPLRRIAARLDRPFVSLPQALLRAAIGLGHRLGLTRHRAGHVAFLAHRPVVSNRALKEKLGYKPLLHSEEVFQAWACAYLGEPRPSACVRALKELTARRSRSGRPRSHPTVAATPATRRADVVTA